MDTKIFFAFGGAIIGSALTYLYGKSSDKKEEKTINKNKENYNKYGPHITAGSYIITTNGNIMTLLLNDKVFIQVNKDSFEKYEKFLQFINKLDGSSVFVQVDGFNWISFSSKQPGAAMSEAIKTLENLVKLKTE